MKQTNFMDTQHPSTAPLLLLLLVSIFLFSGCASFTKATASQQWIDPPAGDVYTNVMLIREAALVSGQSITFQDAVLVYAALGNVRSIGPSDIERDLEKKPDGSYRYRVTTHNSEWLAGLFGGIKEGLAWTVDGILAACGAASNKI